MAAAEQSSTDAHGLACNVWCRHWMGLAEPEPVPQPVTVGPALNLHPAIDAFAAEPAPTIMDAAPRREASTEGKRAPRPEAAMVAILPPRRPSHLRDDAASRSAREDRLAKRGPRIATGETMPPQRPAAVVAAGPSPTGSPAAPPPAPSVSLPFAEEPAFILPTLDPLPSPPPPEVQVANEVAAAVATLPERPAVPAPALVAVAPVEPAPAAAIPAETTVVAAALPPARPTGRPSTGMPPALDVIAALMLQTPARP